MLGYILLLQQEFVLAGSRSGEGAWQECAWSGLQGAFRVAASHPPVDTREWIVRVSSGEGKSQGGLLHETGARYAEGQHVLENPSRGRGAVGGLSSMCSHPALGHRAGAESSPPCLPSTPLG